MAHKHSIPPTAGEFSSLPRSTIISVDLSACDSPGDVDGHRVLPDKTLYNIGMDAAPSDLVLLAPLYGALHGIDESKDTDNRNLRSLVIQEIVANPGYAVVFEIDQSK